MQTMAKGAWLCWCCVLWCLCCFGAGSEATQAPQHSAPAQASGQGHCEVLNTSYTSTYTLSTNITLQPLKQDWLLDFVLKDQHDSRQACVRIRSSESEVVMILFENACEDEFLVDYRYLSGVTFLPHLWTSLSVNVRPNKLHIGCIGGPTSSNGSPQALTPREGWSLPKHHLSVNRTDGVQAAVGCKVNCPHKKFSSQSDSRVNIIETKDDNIFFYFRPRRGFVSLKYEVVCTPVIGRTITQHIEDITLPDHLPFGLWHMVDIQTIHRQTRVELDYKVLRVADLPRSCSVTRSVISMQGEGLVSFCNPSSGASEMVDKFWSCSCPSDASFHPVKVALVAMVTQTLVILSLYFAFKAVRKKDSFV